jgi:hypothetical protein
MSDARRMSLDQQEDDIVPAFRADERMGMIG